MRERLERLAECAQEVADRARSAAGSSAAARDMTALNEAMVAYRQAAVSYMAHPAISDYVRADAIRYDGQTREAVERIADLIDKLNRPD